MGFIYLFIALFGFVFDTERTHFRCVFVFAHKPPIFVQLVRSSNLYNCNPSRTECAHGRLLRASSHRSRLPANPLKQQLLCTKLSHICSHSFRIHLIRVWNDELFKSRNNQVIEWWIQYDEMFINKTLIHLPIFLWIKMISQSARTKIKIQSISCIWLAFIYHLCHGISGRHRQVKSSQCKYCECERKNEKKQSWTALVRILLKIKDSAKEIIRWQQQQQKKSSIRIYNMFRLMLQLKPIHSLSQRTGARWSPHLWANTIWLAENSAGHHLKYPNELRTFDV